MKVAKRRWFRFSLRGLFIVMTVLAVGPAYQLNWIRQRRDALSGGRFSGDTVLADVNPLLPKTVSAPGWLWLYGEPGYVGITMSISERFPQDLTPVEQAEFDRVLHLFPETVQNHLKLLPPAYTRDR
jgi:hypothetical protein